MRRHNVLFGAFIVITALFGGVYAMPVSGQIAPAPISSASPSPAPSPTGAAFMLSQPVERSLVNASPLPNRLGRFDADAGFSESLRLQKNFAANHIVGRATNATVVLQRSTPAPHGSTPPNAAQFREVKPRNGYDPKTGLAPPTFIPQSAPTGLKPKTLSVEKLLDGEQGAFIAPPDLQIAAGDAFVVQVTNTKVSIWDKTKESRVGGYALGPQFQVPDDYTTTDPWIVFDPGSHRWILSVLIWNPSTKDSYFGLAVSTAYDPSKPWTFRNFTFPPDENGPRRRDQPKIAVTDDKVLLAWDEIDDYGVGGNWAVLSKPDLLAGSAELGGHVANTTGDRCFAEPIPAKNVVAGTRGFIVAAIRPEYRDHCDPAAPTPDPSAAAPDATPTATPRATSNLVRVIAVEGPPSAPVTWDRIVSVEPFSAPQDAKDPSGSQSVFTGDSRIVSAVWQPDHLYTGSNDACKVARACFRFLEISTPRDAREQPHVIQDFDVGIAGRLLLYPSLTVDSHGHVIAIVSQIWNRFLGAGVVHRLAGHDDWGMTTIRTGTAVVSCPETDDQFPPGTTRIGDYSGADRDPVDPDVIWLAVGLPPPAISLGIITGAPTACPQTSVLGKFSIK